MRDLTKPPSGPSSQDDARTRLSNAIARLGTGDKSALEIIYRATSAKLFGICLRILGDRKEAEDALQDVYVSLFRSADRFDPQRASPISWLAVFARNRAIDRLRRLRARPSAAPEDAAAEVRDEAALPDEALIARQDDARIHACLNALDSDQKTHIRSAFFRGRSYAELAERAGIPLGTIKSRIRRGLARLKSCLEAGE